MYRVTKKNGTVITVDLPCWVKINKIYNSFVACEENDAECVLLYEGEGEQQTSTYYNIEGKGFYADFDTITITKIR